MLHLYATFNGIQQGLADAGIPSFELWTLEQPLPGLMVGSTYARSTIERALRAATLDTLCAIADAAPSGSHGHN